MAMAVEDGCPICLGSWDDISYVMPCLHQFCYHCILQWAERKPECPLRKRKIQSILHSVQADDDYREHVIAPPVAPSGVVHQERRAASPPATHNSQRRAAEVVPMDAMASFYTPNWLSSFQVQLAPFQTLLSWYHCDLEMFGPLLFGSRETSHRLDGQGARAARVQEGTQEGHLTPSQVTSSSLATSISDDLPSTSSAAIGGGPSSHPPAPSATPEEQEQPQQQPEEAMPGPSTRSRHMQRSTGRRHRPPKRKTCSQEAPPAKKRPPLRL